MSAQRPLGTSAVRKFAMRREAICWACTLWLPAIVAEIPIYTKPPDVDVDDILPGEKPTHYKPLIEQLFASLDKDNSGELDADEWDKVKTLKMQAEDGVETDVWAASKYKRVEPSHWLEKLDKDDSETLTVDEAYMLTPIVGTRAGLRQESYLR